MSQCIKEETCSAEMSNSRPLAKKPRKASPKAVGEVCQHYCTNSEYGLPDAIKVIDFRSDTCSLPTPEMRDAIYQAEVGDSVYDEDPSVTVLIHCNKRGSEIITGSKSHILLFEQAGVAQFGGINIREVENKPDGTFSLTELQNKVRKEDKHTPYTSLICIENTHNVLGGKVLPQQWIDEVCNFARSMKLPVHMDGARIFSASAKLKIPVCEIVKNVDSVSFCLSKNLGAPYGSVLLGTNDFIHRARRTVKALGGGVRQIGFMAAAGLFALENMVARLADDHHNVQIIANAIREMNNPYVIVPPSDEIHSNILMIRLNLSKLTPAEFLVKLSTIYEEEEFPVIIKAFAFDVDYIRFVLCCNISSIDVEDAIRKIRLVINKLK